VDSVDKYGGNNYNYSTYRLTTSPAIYSTAVAMGGGLSWQRDVIRQSVGMFLGFPAGLMTSWISNAASLSDRRY